VADDTRGQTASLLANSSSRLDSKTFLKSRSTTPAWLEASNNAGASVLDLALLPEKLQKKGVVLHIPMRELRAPFNKGGEKTRPTKLK